MLQTLGMALAALCLLSPLTMAQTPYSSSSNTPSREMTCTQEDTKGNCTAVAQPDGTTVSVMGKSAHVGDKMTCVDHQGSLQCTRVAKK